MDKIGNVIISVGFVGGLSQWLTDHEPAIQAAFYLISIAVLMIGFCFKMFDRFKNKDE